jgi:hypothetical protein
VWCSPHVVQGTIMNRIRIWVLALLATAFAPAILPGQSQYSTFTVAVADAASGAPIASAEVLLPSLRMMVRTDSLGQARLPGVPLGAQRVRVRRLGFAPSDITLKFERDTTDAVFRLERSATQLSNVDVSVESVPFGLRDFEIRRKQGIGRFLTENDLVRERNREFADVATTRFPGLAVKMDERGKPHVASTRSNCGSAKVSGGDRARGNGKIVDSGRRSGAGGGSPDGAATASGSCYSTRPCFVQVYLDDMNLGEADDGLVRTWDLAGAEYYTGASMPARYRTSGSACGVLLLWSRWR